MTEPTSSATSVTPTADQPVTGTPAPGSVTPQKPALTVEELLKRIADLEHEHRNAREAEDRLGKKLSAYEKKEKEAEAAQKAADEAQLSEIERTKKQYAELQSQHATAIHQYQELIVHYEVSLQARKVGIREDAVDDVAKLIDWSKLERDEIGRPKNAAKLLETLLQNKPYLAQVESAPTSPAQTAQAPTAGVPAQSAPPAIPAMNPGRTAIAAPNTLPPGQVPSWSDIFKRP